MDKRCVILLLLLNIFVIPAITANSSATIVTNTNYTDTETYFIVGEVKNTGPTNLTSIKISIKFYDETNTTIEESFTFAYLQILPPEKKSPFKIKLQNPSIIPQINRYTLNLEYEQVNYMLPTQLIIKNHNSFTDKKNYLHIFGEVENLGTNTTNVKVFFTGYNNLGQVVLTAVTDVAMKDLHHGEKKPFDLMIIHERVELVNEYVLVAESKDYQSEVIPEFPSPILLLTMLIGISILVKRRQIHR